MAPLQKMAVPSAWEAALESWSARLIAAGLSAETIRTRVNHMRTVARGLQVDPDLVTEDTILEWAGKQRWQAETRHSYYCSIRAFFAFHAHRHTIPDPASRLPSIRRVIPPATPIPDTELRTALESAPLRESLMLRLAAFAGLRCGEIARVHIQDLTHDLFGVSLVVHGKGAVDRLVPISEDLAQDIRTLAADSPTGYLFPGAVDGHLSARWVSRLGGRLLPSPWTMHKLRHRYGTTAYAAGRDLIAVQNLLGHSSVSTTQRYVERPRQAMREAAEFANRLHFDASNSGNPRVAGNASNAATASPAGKKG
ncbi:MAG: tyrosine-type recombinase/integrase [Bowdeniella nasicola]|nr:tyrosine-type recombinase/integrase [Bowdeniella nasicola]